MNRHSSKVRPSRTMPVMRGRRFNHPDEIKKADYLGLLRWMAFRKPAPWPKWVNNPVADPVIERVYGSELRLTFINHATVLIQTAGLNIITDPVYADRVSPVSFIGPKRHCAPGLSYDQLPPIDVVLFSHGHYDHFDIPTLREIDKRFRPKVISPLGNGKLVKKATGGRGIELNWWDDCPLSDDVTATLTPARHWTARWTHDGNYDLWGAFVLQTPSGNIYFAGDTGYGNGDHFREAAANFGEFRAALIPIGAYAPDEMLYVQHINPRDAVKAKADLNAQFALAIHHGTWQLADEGMDEPAIELKRHLATEGLGEDEFRVLSNGGAWDVPLIKKQTVFPSPSVGATQTVLSH